MSDLVTYANPDGYGVPVLGILSWVRPSKTVLGCSGSLFGLGPGLGSTWVTYTAPERNNVLWMDGDPQRRRLLAIVHRVSVFAFCLCALQYPIS